MLPYLYESQWQFMIYITGEIWCPTSPDTCTTHVSLVKLFNFGNCRLWCLLQGLAERSWFVWRCNNFLIKANLSICCLLSRTNVTTLALHTILPLHCCSIYKPRLTHSIRLPYPSSPAMHFSCLWSVKNTLNTSAFFLHVKKNPDVGNLSWNSVESEAFAYFLVASL